MKCLLYGCTMVFLISCCMQLNAQWGIREKAKEKLKERLQESGEVKPADDQTKPESSPAEAGPAEKSTEPAAGPETPEETLQAWSAYTFVPGDKVIFEDDHLYEENGEFPSKWDLFEGYAENAMLGEDKVIKFTLDEDIIFPLIEKEDYLPDHFTIEFDAYFDREVDEEGPTWYWPTHYYVWLWRLHEDDWDLGRFVLGELISGDLTMMDINERKVEIGDKYRGEIPLTAREEKSASLWRHVAIEFNVRSLKVYLDQHRLINIPNISCNPSAFYIGNTSTDEQGIPGTVPDVLIKNIRIAEGGKQLYEQVVSDGKIVTTGIRFSSGKSELKPESMGIINKIAELMQQHGDLCFSIEGHTDSDGEDASNLALSEERAGAVKAQLVDMGIEGDRLETKGWGESNPVDVNTSPEGKANNRRVEFVSL